MAWVMGQMLWPAPVCVRVCVCVCVCVCQLVPAQVKGFNSFPNWMRGADTAQSDPGLASRTVGTEVIYPESDSHADAFRFLSWNLDNSGSALLHIPNYMDVRWKDLQTLRIKKKERETRGISCSD